MQTTKKRTRAARGRRAVVPLALGLALGTISAGVAMANVGLNRNDDPAPTYPTNAKGMTYGSSRDATSPETEPDLIEAIGLDGTRGYIRSDDVILPPPKTPAEALAQQEAQSGREIPLYAVDGETVIGSFAISDGRAVPIDEPKEAAPELDR